MTNQIPTFDSFGRPTWQSDQIGIPSAITNLTTKMLRRDSSERYSSFEEILAEIERFETISERGAVRTVWQIRTIKFLTGSRRARLLTLILLLILVAAVAAYVVVDPELLDRLFRLTSR